jgi:hypothetical protein
MRRLQASPSTANGSRPSQPSNEKQTKHRDDLENVKLIPNILPTYIPPLSNAVNRDRVPGYFEYILVTVNLPKGIHTVQADQDKIVVLKLSDFNLDDRKFYNMLTPHKYLTR